MKIKTLIFVLLLTLSLKAQNLVMNPSFEDTLACSIYISQGPPKLPCIPWFQNTSGSADYWSATYDSTCAWYGVPDGLFGYQFPHTGNAYMGFSCYNNPSQFPDIREYVEGLLTDTLIAGHTYCVNFYISAANKTKYSTDLIGAYFSVDSLINYNTVLYLPVTPQVESPQGVVINDTLNWVQVSGSFMAQGGEKYITIGNFHPDTAITIDSIPVQYGFAYYFLDDVSVIDCTVGINEIKNNINKFKLYPNPTKDKVTCEVVLNKEDKGVILITDLYGRKIKSFDLKPSENKWVLDLSFFANGIYNYHIITNGIERAVGKLAIIK